MAPPEHSDRRRFLCPLSRGHLPILAILVSLFWEADYPTEFLGLDAMILVALLARVVVLLVPSRIPRTRGRSIGGLPARTARGVRKFA